MLEIFKGISDYARAHQVIMEHRLWRYMIIPGILSLCYVLLILLLGHIYFTQISDYINKNWIPEMMRGEAMLVITTFLLWCLYFLIVYMSYKYVVLILFAPFLSYLSEKTEVAVYQHPSPDFEFRQLFEDLLRGLIINLRNMMLTIILTLLAWMMAFVPIIGVMISPLLILLIQSFYDGFGLFDYTLERKKYSVRKSIQFVRKYRGRVIGVGMGFLFFMMVPIIGWTTAPTYGTVAATLAALDKMNQENSVV
jgi:CysZ protein